MFHISSGGQNLNRHGAKARQKRRGLTSRRSCGVLLAFFWRFNSAADEALSAAGCDASIDGHAYVGAHWGVLVLALAVSISACASKEAAGASAAAGSGAGADSANGGAGAAADSGGHAGQGGAGQASANAAEAATGQSGSAGHAPAAHSGGGAGGTGASAAATGGAGGSGGAPAQKPGQTRLIGVGSFGLRGRSDDATSWSYCGSAATGDEHTPELLRAVAYGDGVFIAVGGDANGRVMRSLDGEHWDEDVHPLAACPGEGYPSSCTNWMGALAYLDGVWLAGGGNGATMRSQDAGRTWTGLHHDFPEKHIRTLAAGAGHFIAGTDGGELYVTSDAGGSWKLKSIWSGASSSAYLQVVYGHNTFVAYSEEQDACFVSTDLGDSWQKCAAAAQGGSAYSFDDQQWIAALGSSYATSPDALSWTKHTAASFPQQVQHDGDTYFGRSGTTFYRAGALDHFSAAGDHVADFRAWTVGKVLSENLAITSPAACSDKR
jgi:hypothetical protein